MESCEEHEVNGKVSCLVSDSSPSYYTVSCAGTTFLRSLFLVEEKRYHYVRNSYFQTIGRSELTLRMPSGDD